MDLSKCDKKMVKNVKNSKMTLEKLAAMTQDEFLAMDKKVDDIRENMATKDDLRDMQRENLRIFATKSDLKLFATKNDLSGLRDELKDDIRKGTVDVLRAVDVIVTKFDKAEKDHAADKLLHDRHEKRLERVELKLGIKV